MEFEWAPAKAAANLRKHNVSFDEAVTVFADSSVLRHPIQTTLLTNCDTLRSGGQARNVWSVAVRYGLSAPGDSRGANEEPMKKPLSKSSDELRPEYDLNELFRKGVRGKYAKAYRSGANLVPLDPDVRRAFRNEKTVNDALRLVIQLRKIGQTSL